MIKELPEELFPLRTAKNWLCYRKQWIQERQKFNKIPISPANGKPALKVWETYETAIDALEQYHLDGIGFQLGELQGLDLDGNVLVGVDLDHVIDETGSMAPYAEQIINTLDSYTEYSPSKTGVHILCFVSAGLAPDLKQGHSSDDKIQLYSRDRYFTITGEPYPDKDNAREICKRDEQIKALQEKYFKQKERTTKTASPVALSSQQDAIWVAYMKDHVQEAIWHLDSSKAAVWHQTSVSLRCIGVDFSIFENWSRKDGYKTKNPNEINTQWEWAYKKSRNKNPGDEARQLYHQVCAAGWTPPKDWNRFKVPKPSYNYNWDGSPESPQLPCNVPAKKMDNNTGSREKAVETGKTEPIIHQAKEPTTTGGTIALSNTSLQRKHKLQGKTATQIMRMHFQPVEPIIEGLIYPGLGLFGAPPKTGKSFSCLAIAQAVASGGYWLGKKATTGDVLYLDLENNDQKSQTYMQSMQFGWGLSDEAIDRITIVHQSSVAGNGLQQQIDDWATYEAKKPKLVIIDTLARAQARSQRNETDYEKAARLFGPLQRYAQDKGIAILFTHHLRKYSGIIPDDPFELLSGTVGLFGLADFAWVVVGKRMESEKRMFITSRQSSQEQLLIKTKTQNRRWEIIGNAEDMLELRAKKQFQQSPVVAWIRQNCNQKNQTYSISAKDLYQSIGEKYGLYPQETPQKLASLIRKMSRSLLEVANISTVFPKHTDNPKLFRFKYVGGGIQQEIKEEKK